MFHCLTIEEHTHTQDTFTRMSQGLDLDQTMRAAQHDTAQHSSPIFNVPSNFCVHSHVFQKTKQNKANYCDKSFYA